MARYHARRLQRDYGDLLKKRPWMRPIVLELAAEGVPQSDIERALRV